MKEPKVAFIGLGVMGYHMAGHCQKAGFSTTVYNRTSAKANAWVDEFGGSAAGTPKDAAEGVDFVLVCVGNDDDVRSVFYGDNGLLAALKTDAIVVDHTTTSAELARELNKAVNAVGGSFIDGPVSGGEAGAVNGQLSIMAGGSSEAFEKAQSIFSAYGKVAQLMGAAGAGQLCKMVNQICIAGVLQGLSEGLALAEKTGLDIDQVQKVLAGGAAQSWQLENRAHTMAKDEYDFGFAVDWMVKDLGYALNEAQNNNLNLPLATQVKGFYEQLQANGQNRADTSALFYRLRKLS